MSRRWRWVLVFLYVAGIFALSSLKSPAPAGAPAGSDKLAHFILYYFFAGAIWWALSARRPSMRAALFAFIIAAAYGATDEVHQHFVPGRTMSGWDWLADAAGAAGWAAVMWYSRGRRGPGAPGTPGREEEREKEKGKRLAGDGADARR